MATTEICYHCSLTLPTKDCGPAEAKARWLDSEGELSDKIVTICRECLDAGTSDGPGYREVGSHG